MTGTNHTLGTVTKSSLAMANGIMTGLAWSGTISYAFPTSASDYSYGDENVNGFAAISSAQQTTALFALETDNGNSADDGFSVEGFTLANFESGSTTESTLRFAQSTLPSTAYAYMPTTAAQGGDIWFGTNYDYTAPQAGNYSWHTMLHELGHALGLKHAHETYGTYGLMASANDDVEYTVMSYRAYVGASLTKGYTYSTYSAPQTYMMADIAALQQMYGADYSTNSGDTVYKWDPTSGDTLVNGDVAIDAAGSVIFATIWDGGGDDTYDLSDYTTDLKISLDAGKSSSFGTQLAQLGSTKYAAGNIYNALLYKKDTASLIENATGGSGNDLINGNLLDNTLVGGEGDDKLYGFAGNDVLSGAGGYNYLDGGLGNDSLYVYGTSNNTLIGGAGDDLLYASNSSGTNVLTDTSGNNTVLGGSGTDTITTGAGSDSIYGDAGNDSVSGGAGANYLSGDAGNDSVIGGTGLDTIYGGDGDDYIRGGGGHDLVDGGAGTDTIYADAGDDTILGGEDNDKIYGMSGSNYLSGDAGADTIIGGRGIDTIYGGAGADSITGGVGNDVIYGGDDADIIRGGAGSDILYSDDGADIFQFETTRLMGKDVVYDFDYTTDSLHFDLASLATSFVTLAKQVGSDLVVTFTTAAAVTIKDFDIAHVDDIVFV